MKNLKTIFATMMAFISLTAAFSSCSDDKDTPDTPAAKSIAGTYMGDMTCSVMGSESVFENMTFEVKATDDAAVSVTVSEFGEPPMKLPSIMIEDIRVTGSDGKYTLAPTQFKGNVNGKSYSGTAQGSYSDNKFTFQFNLQYGAMPMPMICSFTAPKK